MRPAEQIRQPKIRVKLERKSYGAVHGFLNVYLKKLIRSAGNNPKYIYITLVKSIPNPTPLVPGYTNYQSSCLLALIKKEIGTTKSKKKRKFTISRRLE